MKNTQKQGVKMCIDQKQNRAVLLKRNEETEKNSKEKKKKEMRVIWVNRSEQCCPYEDTHGDLGASVKMARQGCRLRYVPLRSRG